MKIRRVLLFFLLFVLLIPSISYGEPNPKVYLIVANRLTLEDIKSMENLQRVIEEGSIGLMNTRGTSGYTGAESYSTINASGKAYSNYASSNFSFRDLDGSIVNYSLNRLVNLNKDNNYSPYIGAIGDNLHSVGFKTAIYGNSDLIDAPLRTAALIPMDSNGLIDYGNIEDITIEESDYPFDIKTDYTKLLNEISLSPADFIVGETGDLDRLYRYREFLSDYEFNQIRQKILVDIDHFIGDLAFKLEYENSLLIIISPNSGDIYANGSRLSPLVLWGNNIENGVLTSSTTEREGVVANLDIGPTIMKFLDAPMDNMAGTPIESIKKHITLGDIEENSEQINTASKSRFSTLYYYSIFSMIVVALGGSLLMGKIKLLSPMKDVIRVLFAMVINLPNIFILVSIFRPRTINSFVLILLSLILLSIFILWLTRKMNNQIICISGFTIFIIILDLFLHGSISRYSVLSHDSIIGARYYGIGNEMVGLFLGAITIFSMEILKRNKKGMTLLILLGISIILVGHPGYGANVGGTIAFVVTIIFYILEIFDKGLNLKRIFILGISIVIFVSIMGYIDIRFNTHTTHLGNTILLIKNNGLDYFRQIVFRKLLMNIKLIGSSFWTYLLLLHVALHSLIFYYKKMDKNIMIAGIAGLSGAIGGFLFNDSGLILAAICMNLITAELYIQFVE